ncbi:hypothetical protein ACFL21_03510 [Patescibacteria group bacterium]
MPKGRRSGSFRRIPRGLKRTENNGSVKVEKKNESVKKKTQLSKKDLLKIVGDARDSLMGALNADLTNNEHISQPQNAFQVIEDALDLIEVEVNALDDKGLRTRQELFDFCEKVTKIRAGIKQRFFNSIKRSKSGRHAAVIRSSWNTHVGGIHQDTQSVIEAGFQLPEEVVDSKKKKSMKEILEEQNISYKKEICNKIVWLIRNDNAHTFFQEFHRNEEKSDRVHNFSREDITNSVYLINIFVKVLLQQLGVDDKEKRQNFKKLPFREFMTLLIEKIDLVFVYCRKNLKNKELHRCFNKYVVIPLIEAFNGYKNFDHFYYDSDLKSDPAMPAFTFEDVIRDNGSYYSDITLELGEDDPTSEFLPFFRDEFEYVNDKLKKGKRKKKKKKSDVSKAEIIQGLNDSFFAGLKVRKLIDLDEILERIEKDDWPEEIKPVEEPAVAPKPEDGQVAQPPESIEVAPESEPEPEQVIQAPEPIEVAPEPEPEQVIQAPESIEVAPESEPEQVVQAPEPIEVAPESEPEQVVQAPEPIELAPEPEPETEQVVQPPDPIELAPEPEPETEQVVQPPDPIELAPEPEPETEQVVQPPEPIEVPPQSEPEQVVPEPDSRTEITLEGDEIVADDTRADWIHDPDGNTIEMPALTFEEHQEEQADLEDPFLIEIDDSAFLESQEAEEQETDLRPVLLTVDDAVTTEMPAIKLDEDQRPLLESVVDAETQRKAEKFDELAVGIKEKLKFFDEEILTLFKKLVTVRKKLESMIRKASGLANRFENSKIKLDIMRRKFLNLLFEIDVHFTESMIAEFKEYQPLVDSFKDMKIERIEYHTSSSELVERFREIESKSTQIYNLEREFLKAFSGMDVEDFFGYERSPELQNARDKIEEYIDFIEFVQIEELARTASEINLNSILTFKRQDLVAIRKKIRESEKRNKERKVLLRKTDTTSNTPPV